MRPFGLHKCFYQAAQINGAPLSQEALIRVDRVKLFLTLQRQGMQTFLIAQQLGISKATIFRWVKAYKENGPRGLEPKSRRPKKLRAPQWPRKLIQRIVSLRKEFPLWGKFKLAILLRNEGFSSSESTVGRIIRYLHKKGKIQSAPIFRRSFGKKKRFARRPYAQRLPKGMKPKYVGELVQIDHMTPDKMPGLYCKQFAAICPISRYAVVEIYQNATSYSARDFLRKVLREMPFTVKGIQVDGGSEFMALFEEECKKSGLQLYVLPPRSPELNGAVERSNGTWRYEFYWSYFNYLHLSIEPIRLQLKAFQRIYNEYRPHQGLKGDTPLGYLQKMQSQMAPAVSYVMN